MKWRNVFIVLGAASVGAVVYVRARRAGSLSLSKLTGSVGHLFARAKQGARRLKHKAERAAVHEVAVGVAKATVPIH
jgi:hypothetical protein